MEEIKNLLPDHEEQFAKTFEYITDLIDDDKLDEARNMLSSLHYADLAEFIDNIPYKSYKIVLNLLKNSIQPETLVWLNDSSKQHFIEALGIEKSARLIDGLDLEDAIEVIEYVDEETKYRLLSEFSDTRKNLIIEGFNYPENTVGRVLEKDFVALQENWSIKKAIDSIKLSKAPNNLHTALVVDSKYRPVGSITLSVLLKSPEDNLLKEVMNSQLKVAEPLTPLGDIAFIFKQYALSIVPVVNRNGKLIGSISINNMIYIVEQQAERDIMQLGGVHIRDTFYNLFYTARYRFPWLFVNLITACATSLIINHFSATIAKLITIAAMMPIVASMGGNAGTQAMTVTVRSIANKDINNTNVSKVIIKEVLVCGFNGLFLAVIGAALCFLITGDIRLGIVFSTAIIFNFFIAGLFGSLIPITLHHFDIDPATASGVFLTTITDALGYVSFLALAYVFLV